MSHSGPFRPSAVLAFAALAALLLATAICSMGLGAVRIAPGDIFRSLLTPGALPPGSRASIDMVLWQLRIPRVLAGLLVGATLAMAGALMQGMFRNPLADPGLIGVSGGAALGAVTIIVFSTTLFAGHPWLGDLRLLPLAAFAGALAITLLIQALARTGGYTDVATLLLAGVAVNAIVGAVIGLSVFLASDAQMRTLSFWTLGSLGGASWKTLGLMAPLCVVLLLAAPFFSAALNAIALGEAEAEHLGFSVERVKGILIYLTAAGVGACVAFTGMIGFIGLVTPHLIRLWLGPDHRRLLPASALLGAALLIASDTLARNIAAPAELPIGVITAAFGGPFFLVMLLRRRRRAYSE